MCNHAHTPGTTTVKDASPALPSGYPSVSEILLSRTFNLSVAIKFDKLLGVDCTKSIVQHVAQLKFN